jgi:superfamily I DNA and/or RNA helicase
VSILNQFVNYWYDCIKNEDILGKDISINVRTRAVLYPFNYDPFIFNRNLEPLEVTKDEKISNFAEYLFIKGYEVFYGYPLLYYTEFDEYRNRENHQVAPLFIIRMKYIRENNRLYLDTDESLPSCGIMAFNKLGLKTEEISDIGQKVESIFRKDLDAQTAMEETIKVLQNEVELPINDDINPTDSDSMKIKKSMVQGIYNSNILFSGENTVFNYSLLQDLSELKKRNDLDKTAISFLVNNSGNTGSKNKFIPVLPFTSNEYQINAIKKAFENHLTVITGPPGTGKSQFISNLVINFYLEGKTVLFVSHTNEAVGIVNQKINEQFSNLILRTGRKEYRQELKANFSDLLIDSAKITTESISKEEIKNLWDRILFNRDKILKINRLLKQYESNYAILSDISKELPSDLGSLKLGYSSKFSEFQVIQGLIRELERIEGENFRFFEKLWYFLLPFLKYKKIKEIKTDINSILVESVIYEYITNIKDTQNIQPDIVKIRKKNNRDRLKECLKGFVIYSKNIAIYEEFKNSNKRFEIEKNIKELENKYYELSRKYIRNFYLKDIANKQKHIGAVNTFLNKVSSSRISEDIDSYFFENAIEMLKIWSSTLKSLRRSFPLKPGVFDYVIFDEASQVDLPSAIPALYRAKKAIVVGDPKQLTHIAGITKNLDKEIAKSNKLLEEKEYYPSKIRYCDTSLYFSAENSSYSSPIFLNNHYRSEDEIIGLCNKTFYEERLKIMSSLDFSRFPASLPLGIEWVNCSGEVYKHPAGSRINRKEVEAVIELYRDILKKVTKTDLTLGIVTPYRKQADAISEAVYKITNPEEVQKHDVKVMTAHKFQGSERDIMVFSLVLTSKGNGNSDTWYNIYPQILNVALSRAKYLLYIVGDKDFSRNHSCHYKDGCILKKLVNNYDEIKKQENYEEIAIGRKLDSPIEQYLFEKMQEIDFNSYGYRLFPKLVFKRYTLDFALIPNNQNKNKIDIECDGKQHQIIEGMPVLEDIERDYFLKNHSWKILRFPNFDIRENTTEVINKIVENMKS